MKVFLSFLVIVCGSAWNVQSQSDGYSYKCRKTGSTVFEIKTTSGSDLLPYQGEKIDITKLDFTADGQDIGSYYIYTFRNKIYLLDGSATKLNYTKDQVFFDKKVINYINIKSNGILSDVTLNYLGNLVINDTEFFNYSVTDRVKSKFFLTNIRFDSEMRVDEWRLKSTNGSKCECIKENIRIKLK